MNRPPENEDPHEPASPPVPAVTPLTVPPMEGMFSVSWQAPGATTQMFELLHCSPVGQLEHEALRARSQLSSALTVPQFFPSRAQKSVSLSLVQVAALVMGRAMKSKRTRTALVVPTSALAGTLTRYWPMTERPRYAGAALVTLESRHEVANVSVAMAEALVLALPRQRLNVSAGAGLQ